MITWLVGLGVRLLNVNLERVFVDCEKKKEETKEKIKRENIPKRFASS